MNKYGTLLRLNLINLVRYEDSELVSDVFELIQVFIAFAYNFPSHADTSI